MNDEVLKGGCLTASGESGLSIFRITGRAVPRLIARIFRSSSPAPSAGPSLRFGRLLDGTEVVDEVIVHLATDGRAAEISTHGGGSTRTMVERLLDRAGVKRVEVSELSLGADAPDSQVGAEAMIGLSDAWSLQGVLFFLSAMRGDLVLAIDGIRAALENPPPVDGPAFQELTERLESIRSRAAFGRAFSEAPSLVLAGPPNCGKSTLANRLLGVDRCIVTPEPGTTRDLVRERLSLSGYPFHIADSAGLRRTVDPVEASGVGRTLEAASDADIVLLVLDGSRDLREEDLPTPLARDRRTLVVLNKLDLGCVVDARDLEQRLRRPVRTVSALQGDGLSDLGELIIFRSPFRGPAVREWAVPFSARQEAYLTLAAGCIERDPGAAAIHLRAFLETAERPAPAGVES